MKQTKKLSRNLVLFSLVIIVLFVLLFVLNQASKKTDTTESYRKAPDITAQPVLGNKDAKVTIVEFGDYKCPACKAWGDNILPQLEKTYIETGKAKFSYVNVLFHEEESELSALAGEAVLAANPDQFWSFHKSLYNAQPAVDHDALWITPDKILEVAKTAAPDVDQEQLKAALTGQEALAQVQKDKALVKSFNIQQTPTIMINNVKITDPFDYEAIVKTIEEQLKIN